MVKYANDNNVDDIEDRLVKLPQLDKIELSKLWRKFFHRDPPDAMRKDLMVRVVGHRLQEEVFGGLSPASIRRLRELSKSFEANPEANLSSRPPIKPGTRLVRQWQQQVHVVDVEERGYAYKGVLYDRAASAVTSDQQKNNKSDVELAASIRRSIVDDHSLSTNAHNIKIIVENGAVTLKGPVNSQDEKTAVAAKAAAIVGQDHVTDQAEVATQ